MNDRMETLLRLMQKQAAEKLTFEEQIELDKLLNAQIEEHKRDFLRQRIDEARLSAMLGEYAAIMQESDKISEPVLPDSVVAMPKQRTMRMNWRVAAAVIFMVFLAGYLIFFQKSSPVQDTHPNPISHQASEIIEPGKYSAVLKLPDGREILLDSAGPGLLLQQGDVRVVNENGSLKYDLQGQASATMTYNKLTTSTGQAYALALADGSKVWLNASSSIEFPTAFTGDKREVSVTGEVYFEIAKNRSKPFYVNVNGIEVRVLGTSFNINAYTDEGSVKTSLVEGSVKLRSGVVSGLLEPGQQALMTRVGVGDSEPQYKIEKKIVDMAEVVAWKNGLFHFRGADIAAIMRQISRWYNVEVIYRGKIPARRFEGKISRDAQLSDVLKILELSNVKFSVEGKKIIVRS